MIKDLTIRQENFVLAYLDSQNASAAYRIAYNTERMKEATVNRTAKRLADNPKIIARMNELRKPIIKKAQLRLEDVITENARIAFFDIRTMFDANGNIKPVQDWNDNIGAAVSSIEVFEEFDGHGKDRVYIGQTKKIKFWDKSAALDKLMKHLGGYAEDNKQKEISPLLELVQSIMGTALPVVKDVTTIDMEDIE